MSDSASSDVFDEERLRRLIELMKEHGLREIELREENQQIRLCRAVAETPAIMPPLGFSAFPAGMMASPLPVAPAAAVLSPAAPADAADGPSVVLIKSPMVGTLYRRPNPNAAPFVKVGDHVTPETVICIIEAMKVFNEIPAEITGRIVQVLAQDEEPVEFGKPLFKVDTAG